MSIEDMIQDKPAVNVLVLMDDSTSMDRDIERAVEAYEKIRLRTEKEKLEDCTLEYFPTGHGFIILPELVTANGAMFRPVQYFGELGDKCGYQCSHRESDLIDRLYKRLEEELDFINEEGKSIKEERIYIITNGIDTQSFMHTREELKDLVEKIKEKDNVSIEFPLAGPDDIKEYRKKISDEKQDRIEAGRRYIEHYFDYNYATEFSEMDEMEILEEIRKNEPEERWKKRIDIFYIMFLLDDWDPLDIIMTPGIPITQYFDLAEKIYESREVPAEMTDADEFAESAMDYFRRVKEDKVLTVTPHASFHLKD